MMEIRPWVWKKIMILEDITDIECSICADPVSNHSSEAYFIFTMTLMMKWISAGGKRIRLGRN